MDKDRVVGSAKEIKGAIKQRVGKVRWSEHANAA